MERQLDSVPEGAWAIGVSGGADSTALLCLANKRAELKLHIVHLNHQTRAAASDGDAEFVESLAERFQLPSTIVRRSEIESSVASLPANPSARFRHLRHSLFASVVKQHDLRGVLLAHHAGDQAETVLQRLLRGSGSAGLCGMSDEQIIRGICYHRPMLAVQPPRLRHYLEMIGQSWREDASNLSEKYQRNRVRRLLCHNPDLAAALIDLAKSARAVRSWTTRCAPALPDAFEIRPIADLPNILRRCAVADWLSNRGVAREDLSPAVIDRVVSMATDAATPASIALPGRLLLRRQRGMLSVSSPAALLPGLLPGLPPGLPPAPCPASVATKSP